MLLYLRSTAFSLVALISFALAPATSGAQRAPVPHVPADTAAGPTRTSEPEDARATWHLLLSAISAIAMVTLVIEILKSHGRGQRGPENRG
jgi:hypothetical protein